MFPFAKPGEKLREIQTTVTGEIIPKSQESCVAQAGFLV